MEVSQFGIDVALLSMKSVIYGHYVYKAILSSVLDEELQCQHKVGNSFGKTSLIFSKAPFINFKNMKFNFQKCPTFF